MRPIRYFPAIVLVALAACGDSNPCSPTDSCGAEKVDLAIVDARLSPQNRIGTDDITGLPIYAAAPVAVEFTIVNRGTETSRAQPLSTGETLPALAPNASATITVTHDFTGAVHVVPWSQSAIDARSADQRMLRLELRPGTGQTVIDADPSNDSRDSPAFHVAMPVLTGVIEPIPEPRAHTEHTVRFRLENISVHGGNASGFDVVLCLLDDGEGCSGKWTYFARHDVPDLAAGASIEDSYAAVLGMPGMIAPVVAHRAEIALCVVADDHDRPYLDDTDDCAASAGSATIRPNYLACSPPLAQPLVFLALPEPNCGDAVADPDRLYHVVAFDADARFWYSIQGAPFFVYDIDGEPAPMSEGGFKFDQSGRYYLVAESSDAAFVYVRLM